MNIIDDFTSDQVRAAFQNFSASRDSSVSYQGIHKRISFGSRTASERSSTVSLISQEELQRLIEDANQLPEECSTESGTIIVISLHRESEECTIGITLSGGSDCENKDITVSKITSGTVADKDGTQVSMDSRGLNQ